MTYLSVETAHNENDFMNDASMQGTDAEPFRRYATQFRAQRDAILLLKQLHHMARAVQRHRGMSMALLGGNNMFEGDFAILQRQLERRLVTLELFAEQSGDLLDDRHQQNLHSAWNTIRADWQDDDVIDNFELHSHFIEQLHNMIAELAKKVERPVSSTINIHSEDNEERIHDHVANDEDYPKVFRQIELLNFIARQIPAMVEQMARMRGLATYAAAKGECAEMLERKLRFAMQCVRSEHEKLRLLAERMQSLMGAALPSLSFVKTYELKLMFLLNTIEVDVLSSSNMTGGSHQLFKLATEIIDVYLKVAEEGFDVIARWHDEDLESWLA